MSREKADVCILVSAGAEWRALVPHYPHAIVETTPYGECFKAWLAGQAVCFIQGGWGKVAAAGSTQYAIDRWLPDRLINLGTCGGFRGQVTRGDVILAHRTVIYDIYEQMSDPEAAIACYSIDLDLSWLPESPPQPVKVGTMVSADRDLVPQDIPTLISKYGALVADWESGAIAWVAKRNNTLCMILRAVSDLVGDDGGEADGNYAFFEEQCVPIMANFAQYLPAWLKAFG